MSILKYVINHAWSSLFSSLWLMLTDVHFCIMNSSSIWWEPIVWKQLRKAKLLAARVKMWFQTVRQVFVRGDDCFRANRTWCCRRIHCRICATVCRETECSLNFNNFLFSRGSNQEIVSTRWPRRDFPYSRWSRYLYLDFLVLSRGSHPQQFVPSWCFSFVAWNGHVLGVFCVVGTDISVTGQFVSPKGQSNLALFLSQRPTLVCFCDLEDGYF